MTAHCDFSIVWILRSDEPRSDLADRETPPELIQLNAPNTKLLVKRSYVNFADGHAHQVALRSCEITNSQ